MTEINYEYQSLKIDLLAFNIASLVKFHCFVFIFSSSQGIT